VSREVQRLTGTSSLGKRKEKTSFCRRKSTFNRSEGFQLPGVMKIGRSATWKEWERDLGELDSVGDIRKKETGHKLLSICLAGRGPKEDQGVGDDRKKYIPSSWTVGRGRC